MSRRVCVVVIAVALVGVSPSAAASAATPSCVVKISAMGFRPRHVAPGGTSVVRVKAWNCTKQAQTATLTWIGQFVGPGPGLPAGCPVIDPVAQPITVAPRAQFTSSLGFTVFSACTATSLSATARLTDSTGSVLAAKTATLIIK